MTVKVTKADTRPMNAHEFVSCCETLGMAYEDLAPIVRRSERTLRGYLAGRSDVPPELSALLRLAVRGEITLVRK